MNRCKIFILIVCFVLFPRKSHAQDYRIDSPLIKTVIKFLSDRNFFEFLPQKDKILSGQMDAAKGHYYITPIFDLNRKRRDAIFVFGDSGAHSRRYLLVYENKHCTFYGDDKLELDLLNLNNFITKYKATISCENTLKLYRILIGNYEYLKDGIMLE